MVGWFTGLEIFMYMLLLDKITEYFMLHLSTSACLVLYYVEMTCM
jgi:hypothetical protein